MVGPISLSASVNLMKFVHYDDFSYLKDSLAMGGCVYLLNSFYLSLIITLQVVRR